MKREQKLCLAGGALLLLGALVFATSRIETAPVGGGATAGPTVVDSNRLQGKSRPRNTGSGASPKMLLASRPDSGLDVANDLDPEDSPEFFASLVEEARPVLAEQLREAVTRSHRRIVDRELAAMKQDGQLTDAQADSLRRQLTERFARMVAADVDAVNDGSDGVSDVWNETLARADEWAAETRQAARKMTSADQ